MARRDNPTPKHCPACGGGPSAPDSCKLCHGNAVVDQVIAARWEKARQQRLTAHFDVFVDEAQKLILLLETRNTEQSNKLATAGMKVLEDTRAARGMPIGTPARVDAVRDVMDFNRAALMYLAGGR